MCEKRETDWGLVYNFQRSTRVLFQLMKNAFDAAIQTQQIKYTHNSEIQYKLKKCNKKIIKMVQTMTRSAGTTY